jgi:hypothetical protein
MRLRASPYYRSASSGGPVEDTSFVNESAQLFGVADGCSAAYCPKYPAHLYRQVDLPDEVSGITGGQVVAREFFRLGMTAGPTDDIRDFLRTVNANVRQLHLAEGFEPGHEDVGGASFAVCGVARLVFDYTVTLLLGGDCWALVKTKNDILFLTNFDQAAYDLEQYDNASYARCLAEAQKTGGGRGEAWNLYWPAYRAKRLRTANKNVGQGGFALLNGDPVLEHCWTQEKFSSLEGIETILLGTDGMLPSQATDPNVRGQFQRDLWDRWQKGGVAALIEWRDESEKSLAHISGHPEASMVILTAE